MDKSISLVRLLTIQILVVLLIVTATGGFIAVYNLNQEFKTKNEALRNTLMEEQKLLLKNEMQKALDYFHAEHSQTIKLAKKNLLTETIKFHTFLSSIYKTLEKHKEFSPDIFYDFISNFVTSYEKNGKISFSIIGLNGVGIYYPENKMLEGKSLLHIKDAHQTRIVNEQIEMIRRSKQGFLSTFWEDGETTSQKISFIKLFEPLGWYIDSSVYLDLFTKDIDERLFENLANMRFGKNKDCYFFVNTYEGEMILSNGEVFEARPNVLDFKDSDGVYVVKQNIKIAQENPDGGFSSYAWKRLDGTIGPKISYILPIPGRDMFIGAGVDLANIENMLAIQKDALRAQITKRIYWIIALFVLAVALLYLPILYLARRMRSTIDIFFETFQKAATEYAEIPDEIINFNEFRTIAHSANNLIKALKSQQEEINHKASHDYLTGLPNRLLLTDRLKLAILQAKRTKTKIAVIFMDLDFFKRINDTLGHNVGDIVLKTIALRLKDEIRESDTISRIGGDEFVFILPFITKNEIAFEAIERILRVVNEPLQVNDKTITLGCSLGLSFYPDDGLTGDTLIKHADIAMYEAKQKGRNTFQCFDQTMDTKIHELIEIEREISLGIDNEEFELYYQPKIDINSGKIMGAEALIRWNHPEKGLLAPGYFMQIAEESGLIIPLGKWIIESALSQCKRWHTRGWNLHMAINLSAKQLESHMFVTHTRQAIEAIKIDPKFIEFEITESFSAQSENNISVLNALKSIGVRLAIDDFGTGYSSLSYLHKLPIDTIKIDRSFITGMLESHDKKTLVETIIQTAKTMNFDIVAEGVESQSDLEMLRYLKCEKCQGYLFSKPVPIALFNSLVLNQH